MAESGLGISVATSQLQIKHTLIYKIVAESKVLGWSRYATSQLQIKHTLIYKIVAESKGLGISVRYQPATNKTYTNIQNNG